MAEWLYHIDLNLFFFCNRTIANPVLDALMPFLTDVRNWFSAYLLGAILLLIFGKREGRIALLLLVVTIVVSDQVSSGLIKHWVARVRPCDALEGVRLLTGKTGGFSFPSSHAVNNFAIAAAFAWSYPRFGWIFYLFAFLVAFSRIYLGLHYPSDMLGGATIGIGIGLGISWLADRTIRKERHAER